jgi:beta-fructofuranosidase
MMNVAHATIVLERSTDRSRVWTTVLATAVMLLGSFATNGAEVAQKAAKADKTLVAWVSPANLNQQGGSVLTIQSDERFDAIVFGERARGKWMAGSEFFRRTPADQNANAAETAGPDALVQMAAK